MDLGFALRARCLEAVAAGRVDAGGCVVPVPAAIDAAIATSYLDRKYPATPRAWLTWRQVLRGGCESRGCDSHARHRSRYDGRSPSGFARGPSGSGMRSLFLRYDEARPAHLAVLADRIPHAELAIFENSSHMAFLEEREHYIRVVDDFLARTEARSGAG